MNALMRPVSTDGLGCWHCAAPVDAPGHWPIVIDGVERETCCAGCQAIAAAIGESGLQAYYRARDKAAPRADEVARTRPVHLELFDQPEFEALHVSRDRDFCEATLLVDGLRCGACAWLLEQALAREPGWISARVQMGADRIGLRWDPSKTRLSQLIAAAARIGFSLLPHGSPARESQIASRARARLRRLFIAGLAMMQVMMYTIPLYLADPGTVEPQFESLMRWASLVLTLPVITYSASPFFTGAWRDLRYGKPGMDVPVAVGLASAFLASVVATLRGEGDVWFDTVTMFVFLLLAARHLEWLAKRRAARALERLTAAQPQAVTRLCDDDRSVETIPASRLEPGDRFIVGEGDFVAVDSVVLSRQASFDHSLLTGEALPVSCKAGEEVPGGAVNRGAPVRLQVRRRWADSTLASLTRMAERSALVRPRLAQLSERVASGFVTTLLIFSAGVWVAWLGIDADRAPAVAIAVLVVSCPCALSLATPTALAAASGCALARGLAFKRADALESLAEATDVVFDKTGTLTEGAPALLNIRVPAQASEPFAGSNQASGCADSKLEAENRAIALAAALELGSPHPIARAIRDTAAARGISLPMAHALTSHPGLGVEAIVEGQRYRLGRKSFAVSEKMQRSTDGSLPSQIVAFDGLGSASDESSEKPAQTLDVWLSREGEPIAQLILSDRLRPESEGLVATLREAGLRLHLLSGDRSISVGGLARALGFQQYRSEASPEDKLAYVQALQREGRRVLMVGDGINDAPVLAGADVSVAVGQASALARISADVTLLGSGIASLPMLLRLARRTRRVITQNLAWAVGYNVLAIPLAAFGLLEPWAAALGMSVSSLLVAGNALRLLRDPAGDARGASIFGAAPGPT